MVTEHDVIVVDRVPSPTNTALISLVPTEAAVLLTNASSEIVSLSAKLNDRASLFIASERELAVALPRFLFFLKQKARLGDVTHGDF